MLDSLTGVLSVSEVSPSKEVPPLTPKIPEIPDDFLKSMARDIPVMGFEGGFFVPDHRRRKIEYFVFLLHHQHNIPGYSQVLATLMAHVVQVRAEAGVYEGEYHGASSGYEFQEAFDQVDTFLKVHNIAAMFRQPDLFKVCVGIHAVASRNWRKQNGTRGPPKRGWHAFDENGTVLIVGEPAATH